jgi:hypothetical protein
MGFGDLDIGYFISCIEVSRSVFVESAIDFPFPDP